MNDPRSLNVLFICGGNSARSIMAESLLNTLGASRFRAFSGGLDPAGRINPFAMALLEKNRLLTEGSRSKSWNEFARPDAPELDFVFLLDDASAAASAPAWRGQPIVAQWHSVDPERAEGSNDDKRKAMFHAFSQLQNRIQLFVNLPLAKLDRAALTQRLKDIGRQ